MNGRILPSASRKASLQRGDLDARQSAAINLRVLRLLVFLPADEATRRRLPPCSR